MDLMIFDFEGHQVRTSGTSDDPLFALVDVCRVLELSNPSEVAKRLKPKYLTSEKLRGNGSAQGSRQSESLFVSEPGLYQIMFRSNKPAAERFQDWVFEEVLPSIRKQGGYIASTVSDEQYHALQAKLDAANKDAAFLKSKVRMTQLQGEVETLRTAISLLDEEIGHATKAADVKWLENYKTTYWIPKLKSVEREFYRFRQQLNEEYPAQMAALRGG